MAKPIQLQLDDHQSRELEHIRDHHPIPYIRERATAILKLAQGQVRARSCLASTVQTT